MSHFGSTTAAVPAGNCAQCGGQKYVGLVHHCGTAVAGQFVHAPDPYEEARRRKAAPPASYEAALMEVGYLRSENTELRRVGRHLFAFVRDIRLAANLSPTARRVADALVEMAEPLHLFDSTPNDANPLDTERDVG